VSLSPPPQSAVQVSMSMHQMEVTQDAFLLRTQATLCKLHSVTQCPLVWKRVYQYVIYIRHCVACVRSWKTPSSNCAQWWNFEPEHRAIFPFHVHKVAQSIRVTSSYKGR